MNTQIKLLLFGFVFLLTIPLTVVLALHKPNEPTDQQVLAVSISGSPIMPNKDRLSCTDCLQQGKDGICFNVENKNAYCNSSKTNTVGINVLCRACGSTKPNPSLSITVTPPFGCYYKPIVCTRACPNTNPNCCGDQKTLICPSITPIPRISCYPRPTCLDTTPRCTMPEPAGGWCPRTTIIPLQTQPTAK